MQSGELCARAFLSVLAALGMAGGAAAGTGAAIGPTSRASVEIRVSVGEQARLRMSPPARAGAQADLGVGSCVWSSVKARTFAVTLQRIEQPGTLAAPRSFEIAAGPAGPACNGNAKLGEALGMLADGSSGRFLLILAPQ